MLASAYAEYDIQRPEPGRAELDAVEVWEKVKRTISQISTSAKTDPVQALAVSSLGEAMVPVTHDRQILGPSVLNFDRRGESYLAHLGNVLEKKLLYQINGNTLGNHYSLTKLMWLKEHQPDLYQRAYKFLHWGSFVSFMLGAEPVIDYSLANRTLLFDLEKKNWSNDLLTLTGLDREKLPLTAPSATVVGALDIRLAEELGLPANVSIVTGAHDQCATAVGCGVIQEGQAAYGMGTFFCMTPVFKHRYPSTMMMERGLNTEHHAVPELFVSFIYNQGGALFKWYRDTFATVEAQQAQASGQDIYADLVAEIPEKPSPVMVLPHFETTGPPHFVSDSAGVLAGLRMETTRGDILKGILEGITFYLRECFESLPEMGHEITDFRAVGGGSRSDAWVQLSADILGTPFIRPAITEAGILGAAIIAGNGVGVFSSLAEGCQIMVKLDQDFEPNPNKQELYDHRFEKYRRLWPLMADYLRDIT
jgi:xylulokinase